MKSDLSFINFVVPRFVFEKSPFEDSENSFEINPQAVIIRSSNQFHINVEIEIVDSKNEFNLKMLCIGVFKYNTEDEKTLLDFMSINGPAIVFPYIRSFISSYTALSGFDTITLPTLNLSGHKEKLIQGLIDLDAKKENE